MPGHSIIFSLNFNNDAYADAVTFSPAKREVAVYRGGPNGALRRVFGAGTQYDISSFAPIADASGAIASAAFASRKTRQAGIMRFYASGAFSISKTWKLAGNPAKVITADFLKNGASSLLLCGPALDGITLLSPGGSGGETRFGTGQSFSSIGSGDFNSDGAVDVAAFDYLKNEVRLFYNYGSGVFRAAKSLKAAAFTGKLRVTDINLDGYPDILLPLTTGLQILFGDERHSFERTLLLRRDTPVDKCIYGDFNRDGRFDLALLNKYPGSVAVLFQDQYGEFSQQAEYVQAPDITDIIPYYSKFVNGIAILRNGGSITMLTRETGIRDRLAVLLGGAPAAVALFDHGNDNISDFCFTDTALQRLVLVLRDKAGTPGTLYTIPLFSKFTAIAADDREPYRKRFLLYRRGGRQLELLTVRTDTLGYTREYFYPTAPIAGAVLLARGTEPAVVAAATLHNGTPGCTVYSGGRATTVFEKLGENAKDVSLDQDGNLYYYSVTRDSVQLYAWYRQQPTLVTRLWATDTASVRRMRLFTGDVFNTDSGTLLALVNGSKSSYFLAFSRGFTGFFRNRQLHTALPESAVLYAACSPFRPGGLNRMFIGAEGSTDIYKLGFLRKGRQALIEKLPGNRLQGAFTIGRLHPGAYFAVYTNNEQGTLVFTKL